MTICMCESVCVCVNECEHPPGKQQRGELRYQASGDHNRFRKRPSSGEKETTSLRSLSAVQRGLEMM